MNMTKLAVHRPVTILMLVLGLIVMGVVSYGFLPVRELPYMPQPDIEINTLYPGASPADVRRSITDPLESGLELVNGIYRMTSVSTQGQSMIVLQFAAGISSDTAATDVAQAIHRVAGKLPKDAALPNISQHNPAEIPVIQLALGGRLSPGQLAQYASDQLFPALQSVPGVAGVTVAGTTVPQVDVTVDPAALSAYGVTLDDISRALTNQNASVSGGSIQNGGNSYLTATASPFASVQSLTALAVGVRKNAGGVPVAIKLGQVADVSQALAPSRTMTTVNGETAIGISIGVQNGENSLTVEKEVLKALQAAKKGLPPSVTLSVVGDLTLSTRAALHAVVEDLCIAIALTSLVLYLFLRRAAHTWIVLFAIPSSLIATFTVMFALHFSLDLMSLLGLSLLVGILVDDSIVVLENIDRHLENGLDAPAAAIRGRMEIGAAAVAITLTDVVVYAPVAFVHGTVGELFKEFGLTVVAATLFSLFVSFTLTPMLASRWLKPRVAPRTAPAAQPVPVVPSLPAIQPVPVALPVPDGQSAPESRLQAALHAFMLRYERLLAWALRRRTVVASVAALCLAASLLFVPLGLVRTAFLPDANPNVVQIDAELPVGTALSTTDRTVRELTGKLRQELPSVDVYAVVGRSADGTEASQAATLSVIRPADQTQPSSSRIASAAQAVAQRFPGLRVTTELPNSLVKTGTPPVDVVITGTDPAYVAKLAAEAYARLAKVKGLDEITNHAAEQTPEWQIQLNDDKAAYFHLTSAQVGQAVQTAIQGDAVTTLQASGTAVAENIVVEVKDGSRMDAAQMKQIPVAVQGGRTVLLGDVADIALLPGPAQLAEMNRLLAVHVTANLRSLTTGQAAKLVAHALAGWQLPTGYGYELQGQIADQQLAFAPLTEAFVLSVILIYMLMAALYESFVTPMVVLFSLPLATVGAFVLLLVSGQSLNIFSFIAMIMLMGLVAKNAILLVDRAKHLTAEGMERTAALLQAGRTRLRPIVMTTATMVISMVPLALDRGIGAEDRVPVAVVLIGGMLSSTLLTLVVVPVLYTYFDDIRQSFAAKRRFRRSGREMNVP